MEREPRTTVSRPLADRAPFCKISVNQLKAQAHDLPKNYRLLNGFIEANFGAAAANDRKVRVLPVWTRRNEGRCFPNQTLATVAAKMS